MCHPNISISMERLILQLWIWIFLTVAINNATRDEWQILNQGDPSLVVAVNNKALYAVTSSRLLQVIYDDSGFAKTDGDAIQDVTVNEDYDVWITNTYQQIFYRQGVSSTTLKGTSWTWVSGGLMGMSTSRYGLVFGYNSAGVVYTRIGLSTSSHGGTHWQKLYGANVNDVSCTRRVCFVTTTHTGLFSTGLLQNVDSPTMLLDWIHIDLNVIGVAAYGDKRVWKIDVNGVIWEAVNVYDENMIHLNWVRRSYEEGKFKDVSITDKYSFAVHESGNIYVQTGCPVFDFEENDISSWGHNGTAFENQPVVSQPALTGVSGKFGSFCIDTLSKRRTYDMPVTDASFQGDGPTGTLLSPVFQIRTDVLHFAVGGGSYPHNYVGLIVGNSEVRQSSGKSLERTVSGTKVRMSRLWWDVTEYKGKCGHIKIYDLYSGNWGHTLFDDLRSSPPCSKGMNVILSSHQRDDNISIGQRLVYTLRIKGFYTSSLRPLKIDISFPVTKNKKSFAVIEGMAVTWTYCNKMVDWKRDARQSHANGLSNGMSATFASLLSDASLEIVVRAYDHEDLKVGYPQATSMKVRVDFAGDYAQVFRQNITSRRYGNETAKLLLREEIVDLKEYVIGENITLKVDLSHSYNESLQRAYKVTIRVLIPKYVKFVEVTGLKKTLGDIVDIQETVATVRIPEIELLSTRNISFVMRLDGFENVIARPGRNYSGEILIDAAYYCPRTDCRNKYGNDSEVSTLVMSKFHKFNFQHKNRVKVRANAGMTRIGVGNGSLLFICGRYFEEWRRNCLCWNATRGVWHGMSSMLHNVTHYDAAKEEVYGLSSTGYHIKVYGERFEKQAMLSSSDWDEAVSRSGGFAKSEYITASESVSYRKEAVKYIGYCCT